MPPHGNPAAYYGHPPKHMPDHGDARLQAEVRKWLQIWIVIFFLPAIAVVEVECHLRIFLVWWFECQLCTLCTVHSSGALWCVNQYYAISFLPAGWNCRLLRRNARIPESLAPRAVMLSVELLSGLHTQIHHRLSEIAPPWLFYALPKVNQDLWPLIWFTFKEVVGAPWCIHPLQPPNHRSRTYY